jgi:hypothetical protein
MGTNYYLRTDICPHCGRYEEELHIGKSSVGWKFLFSTDLGKSYSEIFVALQRNKYSIYDEYGRSVKFEELIDLISNKQNGRSHKAEKPDYYIEVDGYDFSERYFR